MESRTTPINIAASSNVHSSGGNDSRPSGAINIGGGQSRAMNAVFGRRESNSGTLAPGSHSGAQPISVNSGGRARRESLAGSMVTGMSWGGASVSSWIRDDIIMQGTSPFGAYQSPSYHSSSYLPKLEAHFMKDFSCCGLTLPSFHDLLQHYEENHAQQPGASLRRESSHNSRGTPPDPKAAIATGAASAIKDPSRSNIAVQDRQQGTTTPQRSATPVQQRTPQPAQQTIRGFQPAPQTSMTQEEGTIGEMEMDDAPMASTDTPQVQYPSQDSTTMMHNFQFGQQPRDRVPPLDLQVTNLGNQFQQYRGLRNSTPTTPISTTRPGTFYHNNPTVSSVNTPTLSTHHQTHPLHQQYYTPESSAPGTPGELDGDVIGNMSMMNMGNPLQYQSYDNFGFGSSNQMPADLCIDDPAVSLYALNGALNPPMQSQQQQQQQTPAPTATTNSGTQLGDQQYSENSELARTIREQQKLAGVPDPSADGVAKPFHCPVIGCEKAYKNQNGLKYHKGHGHNTQTLFSNANGTFSIVDPETHTPYPGIMGMEKHKPYKCDACGKRYKNLNGLKYHKQHSPPCDLKGEYHDKAGGIIQSKGEDMEM